jgi:hypothetical protein
LFIAAGFLVTGSLLVIQLVGTCTANEVGPQDSVGSNLQG